MCYDFESGLVVDKLVEEMAKNGFTPYSLVVVYERMKYFPYGRERTQQDVEQKAWLLHELTRELRPDECIPVVVLP